MSKSHSDDNLLDRHHLLEANQHKARGVFREADHPNTVVIIADLRDRLGRKIAEAHAGPAKTQEMIQQHEGLLIPTLLLSLPVSVASRCFRPSSPQTAKIIQRQAPAGTFWTVAVSNGGNSVGVISIEE